MTPRPRPITPTPAVPEYFDYTAAASDAVLTQDQLRALIRVFEQDYPHDVMLRELHILRAANAVNRGTVTIQQILSTPGEQAA